MKRKFLNNFVYNVFLFICIAILAFTIVSFGREYFKTKKLDKDIVALEGDIKKIEQKNIELTELIKYFDSESYAERRARMELGLKKPDEEVIIIPNQVKQENALRPPKEEKREISNIRRWWYYFFPKK